MRTHPAPAVTMRLRPCSARRRPRQHPPFDQTDRAVGDRAEDAVDDETDEDHIALAVVLGLEHHVAESAGGVDLLQDDQAEPGARDAEPESHEESGQRAGEDDLPYEGEPRQPLDLGEFGEAVVDAGQRGMGVQVDRDVDDDRDDGDLEGLADQTTRVRLLTRLVW